MSWVTTNARPTVLHACALPAKRCQAINSNLESDWMQPNPVARTTRMHGHGHQTALSLGLGGVAHETNENGESM